MPALPVPALPVPALPVPALPLPALPLKDGQDLLSAAEWSAAAGHYRVELADGRKATLTLDHRLQSSVEKLLADYRVPSGAVVALDPRTGRVLAAAEHSETREHGLCFQARYPAASVFKIVTSAALLDSGISEDDTTCYHGGHHRMKERLLKDSRLDGRCVSLSTALAKSANVVFAKLAQKHLTPETLRAWSEKFGFNRPISFTPSPSPEVAQSTAAIPDDAWGFAQSAAGFGQVRLSPLHAAMIAAAVANGGAAHRPTLVDSVDGVPEAPGEEQRLLSPELAARLGEMMKLTVSEGTARKAFRERRGWALPGIVVAGKTGSLSEYKPFQDYSWFVGYAPADHPTIAVAVVVVNSLKWKVHAPYVAREALRAYLVGGSTHPMELVRARRHKSRPHRS